MNLTTGPITDTDDVLVELVVGADRDALADLQAKVLAPLQDVRPVVRDNLLTTLRSWLTHHGRRDDRFAAEVRARRSGVHRRRGRAVAPRRAAPV